MKRLQAESRRTRLLIGVLAVLTAVCAYSLVDVRRARAGLEQAAQRDIDKIHVADNDVAWIVTTWKPMVLFGPTNGMVEVFVQPHYGGKAESIHQVNLYYVRTGGIWKSDGSDASASPEANQRGLEVFARQNPAALAKYRRDADAGK